VGGGGRRQGGGHKGGAEGGGNMRRPRSSRKHPTKVHNSAARYRTATSGCATKKLVTVGQKSGMRPRKIGGREQPEEIKSGKNRKGKHGQIFPGGTHLNGDDGQEPKKGATHTNQKKKKQRYNIKPQKMGQSRREQIPRCDQGAKAGEVKKEEPKPTSQKQ